MEPTTLYPSRKRLMALLAVSVAFVVGGIWTLPTAGRTLWLPILFFGLCGVVFIVMMFPRAGCLKIEKDSFTVVTLFRSYTVRWQDVTAFYAGKVMTNSVVFFDYSAQAAPQQKLRSAAVALCGHHAALPDTYGLSAGNLAALLNEAKQRFDQQAQPKS